MLAGCGYRTAVRGAPLAGGAEQVAVAPFDARTADPEVGVFVTEALREDLARRGLAARDGAASRLDGVVEETAYFPSSPNGATWRLALVVSATLVTEGKPAAEARVRDRRFAQEPDADRRERDPELAGGQGLIDLVELFERLLGAGLALLREVLDPALAGADQGELGRDEESVEEHEQDQQDEKESRHCRSKGLSWSRVLRGRSSSTGTRRR